MLMPHRVKIPPPVLVADSFANGQKIASMGKRIKFARKAMRHLTMQQLADACGVTKGLVSAWEAARVINILPANLYPLSDVLKVSARWIAVGDVPMGRPVHVTPDESDLLDTYRALPANLKDKLLEKAHDYQDASTEGQQSTLQNPYPHMRKK